MSCPGKIASELPGEWASACGKTQGTMSPLSPPWVSVLQVAEIAPLQKKHAGITFLWAAFSLKHSWYFSENKAPIFLAMWTMPLTNFFFPFPDLSFF
jgi:hypothetical protein